MAIPFARPVQQVLESRVGTGFYLLMLVIAAALAAGVAIRTWKPLPCAARAVRALGLVIWGALSAWVGLTQLQTSAESIHFLEYGLLTIMLFRAWRQHVRDPGIYPICLLSLGLIAWVDEFVQWLMPGRYWDYRDLRLNLISGAVFLFFIAGVMIPSGIAFPMARRTLRWSCRLAWALLAVLGLSLVASPRRVDWVAAKFSPLRFLGHNASVLTEFGHRHEDAQGGCFYSRHSRWQLRNLDGRNGVATGHALRRHRAMQDPETFRRSGAFSADPYVREVFDHLVHRDHYYVTGWQYQQTDPVRWAHHMAEAYGENQILETFYPHALDGAGRRWTPSRKNRCASGVAQAVAYVSEVDRHLVTGISERALYGLMVVLAGGLGGIYVRWGREDRRGCCLRGRPDEREKASLH